jgi:hypothetical protein
MLSFVIIASEPPIASGKMRYDAADRVIRLPNEKSVFLGQVAIHNKSTERDVAVKHEMADRSAVDNILGRDDRVLRARSADDPLAPRFELFDDGLIILCPILGIC